MTRYVGLVVAQVRGETREVWWYSIPAQNTKDAMRKLIGASEVDPTDNKDQQDEGMEAAQAMFADWLTTEDHKRTSFYGFRGRVYIHAEADYIIATDKPTAISLYGALELQRIEDST